MTICEATGVDTRGMQVLTANPAPYMISTELAGKPSFGRSHSSNSLRFDQASSRSTSWTIRPVTVTGEAVSNLSVRLKAISGSPLTIIEPAHGLGIGESLIRRVHRIMPCIVRILSCALSLPLTPLHLPERRLSHRRITRTLPVFRQLEAAGLCSNPQSGAAQCLPPRSLQKGLLVTARSPLTTT
ncbi:uncharacterized protein LY79DRAFT_106667 [Colletotrichum navitas]|uniref:Uncharacterized protein n=1 Tax=Colletotrichum navitas TaxID=681940 RepID=A0AAD8Q5L0_9PEZI|nr:uncharacterized protein LY79DRAFT_106667 [Colletotrichum navitas]KAK1595214.1 hypothetical protein LY79DRAFT_106667 [Colletotrichum navitas]